MNTRQLKKLATAVTLAVGFTASAHAALINGEIGFIGSVSMTGGTSLNAPGTSAHSADIFQSSTGLDFLAGSVITSFGTQSGDYSAVPNFFSPITYNDFTFSPFGGTVAPLWSFTHAGKTYSFDLESVNVDTHSQTALVLSGSGTLKITGFDDTPGSWQLTANRSADNSNVTFNLSTDNAAVPEPIEISLLGLGFAALAAKRKTQVSA